MDQVMTVHGRLIMIDPKVRPPLAPLLLLRREMLRRVTANAEESTCFLRVQSGVLPFRQPVPRWRGHPPFSAPSPRQDDSTGFAQLTVRIPSKQRFAAFNRAGQLVGGSLDKVGWVWWVGRGQQPVGWHPAPRAGSAAVRALLPCNRRGSAPTWAAPLLAPPQPRQTCPAAVAGTLGRDSGLQWSLYAIKWFSSDTNA